MTFEPLSLALAEQYLAFTVAQPRSVEGCSCCTTPHQLAALVAKPREQLSATTLDFYARKAMTTVGTPTDFRYFWPRLAELAMAGEFTTDREIVFGKPLYGGHHAWPAHEQIALRALAEALGQWLAAEPLDEEESEADEWICSIGLLAEGLWDVRPLLAPLLQDTPAAWTNLLTFVERNRPDIERKQRLVNAFWESAPRSRAAVLQWYSEESRVREALYTLDTRLAELYGTPMPDRESPTRS